MFIPSFSPSGVVLTERFDLSMWKCSITKLQGETHFVFCNRLGKVHIASFFSFRTHNTLYAPEMLAKMVEPFTKALDMLEVEKSAILGKKSSLFFFFLEVHLIFNRLLKQPQGALSASCHLALP